MKMFGALALIAALALAGCGPAAKPSGDSADLSAAKAKARIIPAPPSGPVYESTGVVNATEGSTVTLDHEGVAGAGLAAGRTTFRTWADVIAESPGEPGARVAFKIQKFENGWALVEMTKR